MFHIAIALETVEWEIESRDDGKLTIINTAYLHDCFECIIQWSCTGFWSCLQSRDCVTYKMCCFNEWSCQQLYSICKNISVQKSTLLLWWDISYWFEAFSKVAWACTNVQAIAMQQKSLVKNLNLTPYNPIIIIIIFNTTYMVIIRRISMLTVVVSVSLCALRNIICLELLRWVPYVELVA